MIFGCSFLGPADQILKVVTFTNLSKSLNFARALGIMEQMQAAHDLWLFISGPAEKQPYSVQKLVWCSEARFVYQGRGRVHSFLRKSSAFGTLRAAPSARDFLSNY